MRWGVPALRISVVLFFSGNGVKWQGGIGETKTDPKWHLHLPPL
jgi:hypothetical protein